MSSPSTLKPPPNPPAWSATKECLQVSGITATQLYAWTGMKFVCYIFKQWLFSTLPIDITTEY